MRKRLSNEVDAKVEGASERVVLVGAPRRWPDKGVTVG